MQSLDSKEKGVGQGNTGYPLASSSDGSLLTLQSPDHAGIRREHEGLVQGWRATNVLQV